MCKKSTLSKKIIQYGKNLSRKYPRLRPFLVKLKKTFAPVAPQFSGWGMKTEHEVPWVDNYDGKIFNRASEDIKKQFQFTKALAYNSKNIDELLWGHWNISYAVRHAIKFAKASYYNFCECGVADGKSAFFALREIYGHEKIAKKSSMHLYDTWSSIKKENSMDSEKSSGGRYGYLDINVTKKNLSEFNHHVIYHQGYIPKSFYSKPEPPENIVCLLIDLNSAKATLSSLEFFFPRLVSGGIILFDDYGWIGYKDTKRVIDKFFYDKPGIILKLPTGQAIYYQR